MSDVKITEPVGFTNRGCLRFLLKDSVMYGGASALALSFMNMHRL